MTPGLVAVIGATGHQGGAAARALLAGGASVRALVRDPGGPTAQALAQLGAEIVPADLQQPRSVADGLAGVERMFFMTTSQTPHGTPGEVADGMTVIDAAARAGVTHIVYSSAGGAERHTGIPHYESKRRVEEHLAASGIAHAVARPTFFMDNLPSTAVQVDASEVVLRLPLPDDVALQMISVADIGAIAATLVMDPDRLPAGSVEIAGDELTGPQMAEAFGRRADRPARYEILPAEAMAHTPGLLTMFEWYARPPSYRADMHRTAELRPGVQDLNAFLDAGSWPAP